MPRMLRKFGRVYMGGRVRHVIPSDVIEEDKEEGIVKYSNGKVVQKPGTIGLLSSEKRGNPIAINTHVIRPFNAPAPRIPRPPPSQYDAPRFTGVQQSQNGGLNSQVNMTGRGFQEEPKEKRNNIKLVL